jgi:hypothetical protein
MTASAALGPSVELLQADLDAAGVRYFSARELLRIRWPAIAKRVGIDTTFFDATPLERQRLVGVANLADVLRERFGAPITVLNGLRPETYNAAVGGAKRSQHIWGRALDLTARDMPKLRSVALVMYRAREIGGLGLYRGNIHIDTRPQRSAWGSMLYK